MRIHLWSAERSSCYRWVLRAYGRDGLELLSRSLKIHQGSVVIVFTVSVIAQAQCQISDITRAYIVRYMRELDKI